MNPMFYDRANPRTVTAGSLILCHSPDIMGFMIRVGERIKWRRASNWNHVAIASETGTNPLVIQATVRGVTGDKHLSDLEGGQIAVVPPTTTMDPRYVVMFAQAQLKDGYAYFGLLGAAIDQLLPGFLRLQLGRESTWICSALAAESWRFGGWLHDWGSIYSVSPAEVAIAIGLDPSLVHPTRLRKKGDNKMSSPVSPLFTEIKDLAEKAIAQGVAFAGYVEVLLHTDLTRFETAAGTAVTVAVGYLVNRLRALHV